MGEFKNWRNRRLHACRATDQIHEIIANLGEEDGSQLPPADSVAHPIHPAMKAELQNMAATLLRLILIANDGNVSPQKLQRF